MPDDDRTTADDDDRTTTGDVRTTADDDRTRTGDGRPTTGGDLIETARELYDLPFHRANGIEVVTATADDARVRWPFDESLVGNPEVPAVHGGVVSAMADLTGALPHVAALGAYTPTIDLRVDYVRHAGEADLVAEAEVRRRGGTVGVSNVTVYSGDLRCAVATGVYKLSSGDESPRETARDE